MSFFDKFKEAVGIDDSDDEEFEEEEKSIIPEERPTYEAKPQTLPPDMKQQTGYKDGRTAPASSISSNTGKYGTREMNLVVQEPQCFEDGRHLVDSLKAKKPIVVNLENLESGLARTIFDFLSGATYALDGNARKVSNHIFVFAPKNVTIAFNQNQKASQQEQEQSPWK